MGLEQQIALDVQSLDLQRSTAVDAKERSLAALFDLSNRLDETFDGYYDAARAAETTARALVEQRVATRVNRDSVAQLSNELANAKAEFLKSHRIPLGGHVEGDFGVYVTGCRPDEHLPRGKRDE